MAKPFPLNPSHPERICWGCDRYCATHALSCGNGAERTMHPAELFGEDWYLHGQSSEALPAQQDKAGDLGPGSLEPGP